MSTVIGKIEKPAAEEFKKARKLYLVPLVYAGKDAPQEYIEKFNLYWEQVEEQVNNLESKMGKINKIYHESISLSGEAGIKVIEELNKKSHHLVKKKCEQGAELQVTEDVQLFTESMDWGNCLRLVISEKVFQRVSEFYREATQKRYEYIARQIDQTLNDNETGMLFIQEGHAVQFPPTIQVFYVSPPALDEIHRWLRERMVAKKT